MFRLTILTVLLFAICSADPRSPRIYNVLISSKKNLSPSHAQPVYEPVLRTTSIGYAFPSFIYHTSFVQSVPTTYINPDYSGYTKIDASPLDQNEQRFKNTAAPSSANQEQEQVEQFVPQENPYALNFGRYLPQEGQNKESLLSSARPEETDPKKVIANLKKNPEIPDVPPPPLPVRVSPKQ